MAYKFILGPNGTDKTEKCMDMIKRCLGHYNHIYYVVPDNHSFSAEKKVSELFGAVSEAKVNVTSFKKLYCDTVNITGEKGLKKLSSVGTKILLSYICIKHKDELNILSKAASRTGFSDILSNLIQEFKIYGITPEDLLVAAEKTGTSLKLKLKDISRLYSLYNDYIKYRFSDAMDEMSILSDMVNNNPEIYRRSLFVFNEFQFFTPDEIKVISSLAKECDFIFAFSFDKDAAEIYSSQKKCIDKLKKALSDHTEKESEFAEQGDRFTNFPEGKYICDNLVYGDNVKFEGEPENIEIHEFSEQYQETEFVAEKIINLIKSGVRYKDILVIARDSDRYLPVISSVFKDYDIPVFINKKLGAANQPSINVVLSALETINENYSYDSMFTYLKTGFSNLNDFETDLLENYVLATGIRVNSWEIPCNYTPYITQIFDDESALEKINLVREKAIAPLANLKSGFSNSSTIKQKAENLFNFLKEIDLFGTISGMVQRFKQENMQTAAYYGRVWNLIISIIDELVDVLGDEKVSTDAFINLFTLGLSMYEISLVPTNVDVVTVVRPEDLNENPEKYVFVVGANDGVYPSVSQIEGLLSDSDREFLDGLGLELAQDTLSKALDENYISLKTFLSAQNKLFITYPVGDTGGGARFISVTVKRIKEIFPRLTIKSHVAFSCVFPDERIVKPKPSFSKYVANLKQGELSSLWTQAGQWYEDSPDWEDRFKLLNKSINFSPKASALESDIVDNLYKNELKLSVSSLEKYANCPFAYFANYALRLKTREKAEMTSMDSGSLMHEAIEKLSGVIIKNNYTWKSAPADFLQREIIKITDEIVLNFEMKFDTTSVRQLRNIARIKEMLCQSVMYIADHLKAGDFEPLGYEIEFGTGKNYEPVSFEIGDKKIKLRGKVDRADIYYDEKGGKYLRVIDYKSGTRDFDFSSMFYGLQIQLVLYLDTLCCETDSNPAGILYFKLFDPAVDAPQSCGDEIIDELISKEHKMTGVVLDDENIVKAMDKSFVKDSRIIPVKKKVDGTFAKSSSIITLNQFKDMQKHINKLIKKVGNEIFSGKIDILPSMHNGKTGCDYCDFKKICFFDEHCGGKYNELEKLKGDQALSLMKKAGEEND